MLNHPWGWDGWCHHMNSKESALHDAMLRALNQFGNYLYGSIPLCDVNVREINFHDCRCYIEKSVIDSPLPPESLEQAKYSIVAEIDGMIDFSSKASNVPSGSHYFFAQSVSFDISYEYKDSKHYFNATVHNNKIEVQFNL